VKKLRKQIDQAHDDELVPFDCVHCGDLPIRIAFAMCLLTVDPMDFNFRI
jgi:hypothetical protein